MPIMTKIGPENVLHDRYGVSIALGNGLVPTRHQAITQSNADLLAMKLSASSDQDDVVILCHSISNP